MKTTYYHGTSADNLPYILKHGLSVSESKLWNCSLDAVYLWESEALAAVNGMEDEDEEYKLQMAFNSASESGQIACATSKDCRIVVFKIELDSEEVGVDNSCENMDHARCIHRDINVSEIVEYSISNDLSLIKGYFINNLCNNDYCGIDFDSMELKVAELFSKSEIYPEDIEEMITWETVSISELV